MKHGFFLLAATLIGFTTLGIVAPILNLSLFDTYIAAIALFAWGYYFYRQKVFRDLDKIINQTLSEAGPLRKEYTVDYVGGHPAFNNRFCRLKIHAKKMVLLPVHIAVKNVSVGVIEYGTIANIRVVPKEELTATTMEENVEEPGTEKAGIETEKTGLKAEPVMIEEKAGEKAGEKAEADQKTESEDPWKHLQPEAAEPVEPVEPLTETDTTVHSSPDHPTMDGLIIVWKHEGQEYRTSFAVDESGFSADEIRDQIEEARELARTFGG